MFGSSSADTIHAKSFKGGHPDGVQDPFDDRIATLRSLIDKKFSTALELLVAVSGLLQPPDYMHIAPILWYQHLDDIASHVVAPVRCPLVHYMPSANRKDPDLLPSYAMRREDP